MNDFQYDPYKSLGFLANAASRLLSKHLTREFEAIGLNVTAEQWNVLVQTRLVSRQKGEDARNNYICLTDYGRCLRDQSVEIGHALLERVQTGLDESELAAARRVLTAFCSSLRPGRKSCMSAREQE